MAFIDDPRQPASATSAKPGSASSLQGRRPSMTPAERPAAAVVRGVCAAGRGRAGRLRRACTPSGSRSRPPSSSSLGLNGSSSSASMTTSPGWSAYACSIQNPGGARPPHASGCRRRRPDAIADHHRGRAHHGRLGPCLHEFSVVVKPRRLAPGPGCERIASFSLPRRRRLTALRRSPRAHPAAVADCAGADAIRLPPMADVDGAASDVGEIVPRR